MSDICSYLLSFTAVIVRRLRRLKIRQLYAIAALGVCIFYTLYFWQTSNHGPYLDAVDVVDINSIKNQADQKCVHPSLTLWNSDVKLSKRPSPLQCTTVEKNWVYTANGSFHISPVAVRSHGSIECEYRAILRGADDFSIQSGSTLKINDGDKLPTDFFEATCNSSDGKSYKNKHSGVAFNQTVASLSGENGNKTSLGLDIIIFGFDSVSRMAWMRSLPKSHSYFTDKLGVLVLEGYNIVGDGTTQALLPILTGKTESELPESRRGFEGADSVDGFPWIWNDLKDIGYVTQFGEDQPKYGTFTYRLLGFQNQPVDHYMRPFHLAVQNDRRSSYCLKGSNPEYLEMMNWLREFVDVYKNQRKFSFVFDAEFTHNSGHYLRLADDDLLNLLKYLYESRHLDNSLFLLISDHGARFTGLRETNQGRLEERNPYIGIRLPNRFIRDHPDAYKNLRTNIHRLTTPFDLHSTLREVINFSGTAMGNLGDRGISLFKQVPKERTCADAGIEAHWCACLSWTPQNVFNPLVIRAAQEIVQMFNKLTESERGQCKKLSLMEIRSAVTYTTNDGVLKFRKSLDRHGREPDLNDDRKAGAHLYLVTLVTTPGDGLFEATATYRLQDDVFAIDSKSLSRINKYGTQPHCLMDKFPHLRQFCYCVHQLN